MKSFGGSSYMGLLSTIAYDDVDSLIKSQEMYGDSWIKRGGVGAFFSIIRKFDRFDNTCEKFGYDLLKALDEDSSRDTFLDTIRDIRRYLMLVEAYYLFNKRKS